MTQNTRLPRSLTTGVALATVAVLALTACAPTQAAAHDKPARAELKALMTDAVRAGVPGVVVRIDPGDDSRQKPYGLTQRARWAERFSADDTFRVGSNTKTATAVLVLQLVDEGRLDLDDPVSTWFADTVPGSETMTVRMLLNHTSGLADYAFEPEILAAMAGHRDDLPTDQELIAAGVRATTAGEPIVGYHYSNTGYTLLGGIVEQITGDTLEEALEERITAPLGLTETRFAERDAGETAEIHGYEPDAAGLEPLRPLLPPGTPDDFAMAGPDAAPGWTDVTQIDQSWDQAAGSILSTSTEWATFQRALMSGDLLPADLMAEMQDVSPEDDESGPGRSYGLGLEKVETPCGAVWGHDGALPGYRTDTYTDRAGTRSMTVVSTTHFGLFAMPEASAAHDRLVDAAACAMYGKPLPHAGSATS